MKIQSTAILLLLTLLLLPACRKSVLNELVVDAANIFTVKVKIEEKRKNKRQLQVSIRDKTNHPMKFGTGDVYINGNDTEWSSRDIITRSRGYNYRIGDNEHEFEITIFWNAIDSYTFIVDKDAGFPGFKENPVGWNINRNSKEFVITPAPFRDNQITVVYDIM